MPTEYGLLPRFGATERRLDQNAFDQLAYALDDYQRAQRHFAQVMRAVYGREPEDTGLDWAELEDASLGDLMNTLDLMPPSDTPLVTPRPAVSE